MSAIAILFVVTALYGNGPIAWGSDQHMICKTVQSVFDGETHVLPNSIPQTLQGRTGKRGVKGERGVPGLKGENGLPGSVDMQLVRDIIREEVDNETKSLRDEIAELKQRIVVPESKPDICPGVPTEGKCYVAVVHETYDVRLSDGDQFCADSGGKPADILNVAQQNAMEIYLRGLIPSSKNDIFLGLGVTFDTDTRRLRSSSGVLRSLRWFSGFPVSGPTYTAVALQVNRDATSPNNGIWNTLTSGLTYGFICEV